LSLKPWVLVHLSSKSCKTKDGLIKDCGLTKSSVDKALREVRRTDMIKIVDDEIATNLFRGIAWWS